MINDKTLITVIHLLSAIGLACFNLDRIIYTTFKVILILLTFYFLFCNFCFIKSTQKWNDALSMIESITKKTGITITHTNAA